MARAQCQDHRRWAIVALEKGQDFRTGTMIAVQPVRGFGATDPVIPTHVLYSSELVALGFCVPGADAAAIANERSRVHFWQVGENGAALELKKLDIVDAPLAQLGEVYYAPPGTSPGGWLPGHYAYEVPDPLTPSSFDWFAFEFVRFPAPR